MSGNTTTKMLRPYEEQIDVAGFFTSLFQLPPENIYTQRKFEIDYVRHVRAMATPVTSISDTARLVRNSDFVNKEFEAPTYMEGDNINSEMARDRVAGNDPFKDFSFVNNLVSRMLRETKLAMQRIQRAIEFQAAQVMQTGGATLVDAAGNALYTISHGANAAMFPTATVAWTIGNTGVGEDKYGDLSALASEIHKRGKKIVDTGIFGITAFNKFKRDPLYLAEADNRRFEDQVDLKYKREDTGVVYRGTVQLEHVKLQVWTYDQYYEDPQNPGVDVPYMDPDTVILMHMNARRDATYGMMPLLREIDPRLSRLFPSQIRNGGQRIAVDLNAYFTQDNRNVRFEVSTRPLMVPTARDTYGALTTV